MNDVHMVPSVTTMALDAPHSTACGLAPHLDWRTWFALGLLAVVFTAFALIHPRGLSVATVTLGPTK